MKTESVKTIVLAVLFMTCVALTSKVMEGSSFFGKNENSPIILSHQSNIEDVMSPQSYVISFGGGLHTGVFDVATQDKIWTIVKGILKQSLSTGKSEMIDDADWTTAFNNRGLTFHMPFQHDASLLSALTGADIKVSLKTVDTILVTFEPDPVVYLGNVRAREYVKLAMGEDLTDAMVTGGQVIQEIINQAEKSGYIEFRTLESIYSIKKSLNVEETNNALIPILPVETFKPFVMKNAAATGSFSPEETRSLAANAFGSDLSFVKKIEDSDGSIIYLYGYGEKALKVNVDGSLEFKQTRPLDKKSVTFKEALSIALESITQHGQKLDSLVLNDFQFIDTQDATQYEFRFTFMMAGIPLHIMNGENRYPIVVRIENGSVTQLTINGNASMWTDAESIRESKAIEEILDQNYMIFSADNPLKGQEEKDRTYSYRLLDRLSVVDIVYYLKVDGDVSIAYPCWKVELGDTRYFFDWYDGTLIEKQVIVREVQ